MPGPMSQCCLASHRESLSAASPRSPTSLQLRLGVKYLSSVFFFAFTMLGLHSVISCTWTEFCIVSALQRYQQCLPRQLLFCLRQTTCCTRRAARPAIRTKPVITLPRLQDAAKTGTPTCRACDTWHSIALPHSPGGEQLSMASVGAQSLLVLSPHWMLKQPSIY